MTILQAEAAYKLVLKYWSKYIDEPVAGPTVSTEIFVEDNVGRSSRPGGSIEFIPMDSWQDRYKGAHGPGVARRAEALTFDYDAGGTIIVQDGYYTLGTLVHEYLHVVSHPGFRLHTDITPSMNEGLTEYLARLTCAGISEGCTIEARRPRFGPGNFYGEECARFAALRIIDADTAPPTTEGSIATLVLRDRSIVSLDTMCKAYFQADRASIRIVSAMY